MSGTDSRQVSAPVTSYATSEFGLRAEHVSGHRGWRVEDLVRSGLRRNPKRAHLWVSTVLGKHIPVPPAVIFAAAADLGDLVTSALHEHGATDALVFGFAETATGLGHAVAHRMGAGHYLQSTRRFESDVPVIARFEEGHSHATDHLVVPTDPQSLHTDLPVVLVDDEISTGATALDAIRSMQELHHRSLYIVASLVDMRTDRDVTRCQERARDMGVDIVFISLAQGVTHIPDDLPAQVVALPPGPQQHPGSPGRVERLEVSWPEHVPDGGRYGFGHGDWPAFDQAVIVIAGQVAAVLDPARPVIVIGHEEFMYLPQRIAGELSSVVEAPILSQTTTRSPAHVIDHKGYPLRRGYRFIAPEPDAAPDRFLYNATREHPGAQLVVVVDSPADTVALTAPDGLLETLRRGGDDVLVVIVPGTDHRALRATRGQQ
ncbi:UNVERIFIED_CONTAM: phosphoribosyltransferase-like predicted ribonucleoside biosynthesis protein [Williamsia faeni]